MPMPGNTVLDDIRSDERFPADASTTSIPRSTSIDDVVGDVGSSPDASTTSTPRAICLDDVSAGVGSSADAFTTSMPQRGLDIDLNLPPPDEMKMVRRDIGWKNQFVELGTKRAIVCSFCHKIIRGGRMTRLKKHLDGIGRNIIGCTNVLPDVQLDIKAPIQDFVARRILLGHRGKGKPPG